jgi:hypothetical protein
MDLNQLFMELGVSAQRRLWLLSKVIDGASPDALRLAELMERFVVHGIGAEPAELDRETQTAPPGESNGTAAPGPVGKWTILPHLPRPATASAPAHGASASSPRPGKDEPPVNVEQFLPEPGVEQAQTKMRPAEIARADAGKLLDVARRQAFIAALERGANNDELARTFGITRRQANGLRMGILKQRPGLCPPRRPTASPAKEIDRETELRLQNDFLNRRPRVEETLEDVVRFLRQRDDVIVRSGQNFVVNGAELSPAELLERANEKCQTLHRPPFPVSAAGSFVSGSAATNGRTSV